MESHKVLGFPEIKWFFRKVDKLELPSDPDEAHWALDQWKKVRAFRKRMQDSNNPIFWKEYPSSVGFAEVFERDLNQWLADPARPWAAERRTNKQGTGLSINVFINYRRDDSAGHAGRVHDRLKQDLGRDLLFMDVDAIPLGLNFIKVLHEEVARCDVFLALIGPNWLNARDENGNRRLDNPRDPVRIEIAAALERNIPVIPIMLDGAKIPRPDQLSSDIKELAERNGLDVRHGSFHNDMDKLIRSLKTYQSRQQDKQGTPSGS
jgi:hypothetical protein